MAEAVIGAIVAIGTTAYQADKSRDARLEAKGERKQEQARQQALENEFASRQRVDLEGQRMQEQRRRQRQLSGLSDGNAETVKAGAGDFGYKTELGE